MNELHWFKSSHSDSEGAECLEIAHHPHTTHVRDSKLGSGPQGSQLTFPAPTWANFIAHIPEA
ncbi:DUF397 domain-containing protein [Streptomyces sp. I05A-00742]|uniref:DUF397 domain-containing protein n=1 Tax=Streptomyces sp. I05A-00742 TaxID=2732853 RepID=UPI00148821D9|nr:DUF397 domain-containing protein [Streptomyces sp. I05A-00742]